MICIELCELPEKYNFKYKKQKKFSAWNYKEDYREEYIDYKYKDNGEIQEYCHLCGLELIGDEDDYCNICLKYNTEDNSDIFNDISY